MILGILLWYRRKLVARWREPVLEHPVLIIESDDWGAGPVEPQAKAPPPRGHAHAKDCTGRHPVMTLGLVLAGRMDRHPRHGAVPSHHPGRSHVRAGARRHRARAQGECLHLAAYSLEHYWPPALRKAYTTVASGRGARRTERSDRENERSESLAKANLQVMPELHNRVREGLHDRRERAERKAHGAQRPRHNNELGEGAKTKFRRRLTSAKPM